MFRVSLDLDDDNFSQYNDLPSIEFNISANEHETVYFSDDNGSSSNVRSLFDIGGNAVIGLADDPYSLDWLDTVGSNSVVLTRQPTSEIFFGTQRYIGASSASSFTNLVRSGSTLLPPPLQHLKVRVNHLLLLFV